NATVRGNRTALTTSLFYASGAPRDLHSFPTRRSSDLCQGRHDHQPLRRRLEDTSTPRAQSRAPRRFPGSDSRPCSLPRCRRCARDRKSTRLNSSHVKISYAVFCLKKKKRKNELKRSQD